MPFKKYLILTALAATPVGVVLAVGTTAKRETADVHRARWEYQLVREADLASSDESASTTLVKYTEGAPSPTPVSPVAQQKQLKLNALGTQGWELVAVQEGCMIFRRSTN